MHSSGLDSPLKPASQCCPQRDHTPPDVAGRRIHNWTTLTGLQVPAQHRAHMRLSSMKVIRIARPTWRPAGQALPWGPPVSDAGGAGRGDAWCPDHLLGVPVDRASIRTRMRAALGPVQYGQPVSRVWALQSQNRPRGGRQSPQSPGYRHRSHPQRPPDRMVSGFAVSQPPPAEPGATVRRLRPSSRAPASARPAVGRRR